MFSVLASAALLSTQPRFASRPARAPVEIGWHDEFRRVGDWHSLDMENRARVDFVRLGDVRLSLGQVPANWPYAYQWSGLKRDLRVEVDRYPVLMALVTHVQGYAHLDIDVLDANGRAVRTLRSSTLNVSTLPKAAAGSGLEGPRSSKPEILSGVVEADLGKELLPGTYRLQVRLIVGGDNSGCSAEYHWLRFVATKDAQRLLNGCSE